ncbi:MAG: disulfide bond formation protein B [Actinomycetota bacterium]|nr:disulfide bond formation protein B [Actinomycetota bacterium]
MNVMQRLNALGALAAAAVIGGAMFFEFSQDQEPCSFCMMIRFCFTGIALGALLNVRWGIRVSHYGLMLFSAVLGIVISFFDVVSSYPPISSWGSTPFMGLHLASWGFIAFVAASVLIGLMLMFERQFAGQPNSDRGLPLTGSWSWLAHASVIVLGLVTLTDVVISTQVCGLGFCG